MIYRDDYMSGKFTHREYYAQFVTEDIKRLVLMNFTREELSASYKRDKHFNDGSTPLHKWDSMAQGVSVKFSQYGDSPSLAGKVCVLKEAALEILGE